MKVKVLTTIDVACSRCGLSSVTFRAKGMCHNCYQTWYYQTRLKPARKPAVKMPRA